MNNLEGIPAVAHAAPVQAFDSAVRRAEAEFREMPGLKLTTTQAARLWGYDVPLAETVLNQLADARFLVRTDNGAFYRLR